MGRRRSTALLTGLIAALLVGCGSRQDSGPPTPPKGKNNLALEANHPGMARLTIEVRSREWSPLENDIIAVNGRAVGGVFVPPGSTREIVVSAFDASGAETHRGQAQREFSELASMVLPHVPVLPLAAGEAFVLQLAPQRLELERTDGERGVIQLRARVFDPDGELPPPPFGEIRYGLNDVRDYKLVPVPDDGIELFPLQTGQTATLCRADVTAYACRLGVCDTVDICRDPWVAIAAGGNHSCAITRSGVAYCWGQNRNGELGASTQELCGGPPHIPCSPKPTPVTCPPGAAPCRFKSIAAGERGSCAIDTNDDLWCWGFGSTAHTRIVALLAGARVRFTSAAVGQSHFCAISDRNDLWCAGENGAGQLGLPRTTPRVSVARHSGFWFRSVSGKW